MSTSIDNSNSHLNLQQTVNPPPSGRSVKSAVFSLVAIVVGVVTGFGAVFFRELIALVHNLFY